MNADQTQQRITDLLDVAELGITFDLDEPVLNGAARSALNAYTAIRDLRTALVRSGLLDSLDNIIRASNARAAELDAEMSEAIAELERSLEAAAA